MVYDGKLKCLAEGGNPGLVVMGGESRSKGHRFESRCWMLDAHDIFTLICRKNCIVCLEKTANNLKRGRGWSIFFKKMLSSTLTKNVFCAMLPLCFMIRETQSGHVLKMQLESALPRKNPTFNERERGSAYLRAPYNEWLFVYEKRYKEGWGNE